LRLVAHDANLPFLASLIAVALEEAKSTKSAGKSQGVDQRYELPAVALEAPGELELEQNDMHFAVLDPGRTDQFVDIDGARAERGDDPLPLALADVGQGLGRALFIRGGKFG
jgi:hypothetical protein